MIASGSLDIEAYWSSDNQTWNSIDGDSTVFPQVLWEPGYTLVRYIKVVNKGSLALSYSLSMTAENPGPLADVIDVYSAPNAVALSRDTIQSVLTDSDNLSNVVNTVFFRDTLLPGKEAVYTVALKMREEAGNQYMNQLLSDISVKVLATQTTHETDAFDNLYDQNAGLAAENPVEDLQNKYHFEYYTSLVDAINNVNNGTPGANAEAEKGDSPVGVYIDENNVVHVVLLKDIALTESIKPTVDMTINLGGHVLSATTGTAITVNSGNIYIDGSIRGSGIDVKVPEDKTAKAIAINKNAAVTIKGGVITNEGVNTTTPAIHCLGTFNAANTTIVSKSVSARCDGISLSGGATANIQDCNISAYSEDAKAYGVYVSKNCNVTITNSTIKGYADYISNGSKYTACSMGIYHSANSTLTLNNCEVDGNIAGIQSYGNLYINGGTYGGYGHGAFYFVGNSATAYIRNATIRETAMTAGYETNNGSNHTGFYMGGGSYNSIYMDSCTIESSGDAVVLRDTTGDSLYISNSKIGEGQRIRIDSTAQKLYLGQGNNFTAANTTLPDAVVETNETYGMN